MSHTSADLMKNPEGSAIYQALQSKGEEQEALFRLARQKRHTAFPDCTVEVRSVIEVSNICRQRCKYCGMNACFERKRYTIDYDELIGISCSLYNKGRRVLLLQSGENDSPSYVDFISRCVAEMKRRHEGLTLILCLGNLSFKQFRQLKEAGADRYILKFETSNPQLYKQIKPGDSIESRTEGIHRLIDLGFEVGSGNIIGLPGQSLDDIHNDLLFISQLNLAMISCSVFIPGKNTVFETMPAGDTDIALNFMALLRILYPHTLIPTTSSLGKGKTGGQYLGLMAGANAVTIHEGTPEELKKEYPIYSQDRFTPDEESIRTILDQANLKFAFP